jgi:hypothetical protein
MSFAGRFTVAGSVSVAGLRTIARRLYYVPAQRVVQGLRQLLGDGLGLGLADSVTADGSGVDDGVPDPSRPPLGGADETAVEG